MNIVLNQYNSIVKFLGFILAFVLVATLITFMPNTKQAFAEENTSPSPTVAEADPSPKWVTLETIENEDNSVTLKATLDSKIEDSASIAYLYQEGNDAPIDSKNTGKVVQFNVPRPATSYVQYKIVVNELTSNLVTVDTLNANWEVNLTPSVTSFSSSESTPHLTWDINQVLYRNEGNYAIYVVDETTGSIVWLNGDANSLTGLAQIQRFYDGDFHEYAAYIAAYSSVISTKAELNDIQAISNSVRISRTPWTIDATISTAQFQTNDSTPYISWTVNQDIYHSNLYAMYVVDESSGTIVNSNNWTTSLSGTIAVGRFYDGPERTFVVYIAERNNNASTKDQLQNIQVASQPLSLTRSEWEIDLAIDKTTYASNEDTPVLTWTTNQPVYQSNNYATYIVDETTGSIINFNYLNTTLQAQIASSRFYEGGPHEYKAYIAKRNGNISTKDQLEDIQATSQTVQAKRTEWTIDVTIDKNIYSTDDSTPVITYTTNQPIYQSNNYGVYLANETTNLVTLLNIYTTTNQATSIVGKMMDGDPQVYRLYVGKRDNSVYTIDQIQDIQTSSNTFTLTRKAWDISLTMNKVPDANLNKYLYTINTNQTIYLSGNHYAVFLVNEQDNSAFIIPAFHSISSKTWSDILNKYKDAPSSYYRAYVAKTNYRVVAKSDLVDIQAISNGIFIDNSLEYIETETIGGANPSQADCNQQCYGDPVNSSSGEFFENTTDLEIDSAIPFSLSRSYSSTKADQLGNMGYGWSNNYDMSIVKGKSEPSTATLNSASEVVIYQENGSTTVFTKLPDGTYTAPQKVLATLVLNSQNNTLIFERNNGFKFIFDAISGKLISISDRNNNSLSLTYSANNKLNQITNNAGKTMTFTWDDSLIVSVEDNAGRVVEYAYSTTNTNQLSIVDLPEVEGHDQYVYNENNLITGIVAPNGGVHRNLYDSESRVIEQTDPLNAVTAFRYVKNASVINAAVVTLPDGTLNVEEYNENNQLVKKTVAFGEPEEIINTYEYSSSGQVSKEVDGEGQISYYFYDFKGNTIRTVDALGATTTLTYNDFNQVLTITNALGNTSTNVYDPKGNLVQITSFAGRVTQYEVNPDGTQLSIKAPNQVANNTNEVTSFAQDSNGFISSVTSPSGSVSTMTNNDLGLPLSIQDASGTSVSYTYDALNRLTKVTYPNGAEGDTEYDNAGNIVKETNSLNQETIYTYDLMGKVTRIVNPAGTTNYSYDNRGQLIESIDFANRTTSSEYDAIGNLISSTDAKGNITTQTWSKNSLVKTATDSLGNTTSYFYDAVGNLTKVTDALGNDTLATYDAIGQVVTSTNPNGVTQSYEYDADGKLTKTTRNDGSVLTTEYDYNGNPTKTIDAAGKIQHMTYDVNNNLTSTTDKIGTITSYQYNALNQQIKTVRPDSSESAYSYTVLGALDSITYDNWATIDTSYEYDIAGRKTSEFKKGVETTYAYDSIGNLMSRGPPTGSKVEYSYNAAQELEQLTYQNGLEVNYEYDLNGNMTKVLANQVLLASYDYNANDLLTKTTYKNGVIEENTYDSVSQNTSIDIKSGTTNLYNQEVTLNESGFIVATQTEKSGNSTSASFAYDSLERLDNVTQGTNVDDYGFDANDNLTLAKDGVHSYNDLGQVLSSQYTNSNANYTYDARGNRVTKESVTSTSGSTATNTTSYEWSLDNKLANYIDVTSNTTKDIDYRYDANGLLVEKDGTKTTGSNQANISENYSWDTNSSIPILLEDKNFSYIYGTKATPLAQNPKSSTSFNDISYLHGDERNSVILTTDKDGDIDSIYSYDAYGNKGENVNDSTVRTTSFGYAGEYLDQDTGLYNLRARMYDAQIGSFLSIDPAVLSTGEAYSYGSSNPLSNTDPLGLFSMSALSNGFAGVADGITFGAYSSVVNAIAPGTFDTCSSAYQVGMVASMFVPIPGALPARLIGMGAKLAVKTYQATTKVGGAVVSSIKANERIKTVLKARALNAESGATVSASPDPWWLVNKRNGDAAADNLAVIKGLNPKHRSAGGDREVGVPTRLGIRYVDVADDAGKIIYESKAGFTVLSSKIKTQVLKDVAIVNDPRSGYTKFVWAFSRSPKTSLRGPNKSLEQFILNNGGNIEYI